MDFSGFLMIFPRFSEMPRGNDVTVAFGAEAGQLELNVMEPVIIYKLFSSFGIDGWYGYGIRWN